MVGYKTRTFSCRSDILSPQPLPYIPFGFLEYTRVSGFSPVRHRPAMLHGRRGCGTLLDRFETGLLPGTSGNRGAPCSPGANTWLS